jgi:hypothetical protein
MWGGVAALVVVSAVAGWFAMNGRGADPPVTTDPPAMTSTDAGSDAPANTPAGTDGGRQSNSGASVPAGTPIRPAGGSDGGSSAAPPPPPPPSAPPVAAVTASRDSASVWNLLFALDEDPDAARLRSVRDSAEAIYARTAGDTQARAAYVAGSARFYLKDMPGCVNWIQRAIAVRSDDSYVLQLNTCRSGS